MSSPIINPIPFPYGDPIAKVREVFDGNSLREVIEYLRKVGKQVYITDPWSQALDQQQQQLSSSPVTVNQVHEENQSAAIASTDLAGSTVAGGLYEVKAYQRITAADGVSSSTQITIGWTDGSVLQSETFTALTGDTTTTKLTGASKVFRSDAGTPITYAVSYASNTPAKMKFGLDLVLARVAA